MFSSRHRIVTPKITQPDSGGNPVLWIVVVLILLAWSWFVFDYAKKHSGADISYFDSEVARLNNEILVLQKRIEELRLESATFQRSAQVDKTAATLAKQDLKIFQQEKADLKREVEFLNGLLSDKNKKSIVRLKHFNLMKLEQKNRFSMNLTLVHLSKVAGTVKGKLSIHIEGYQSGKSVKLNMADLVITDNDIQKLGFKNFQKIEGDFELPGDFVPNAVIVSANFDGKKLDEFSETVPWQIN